MTSTLLDPNRLDSRCLLYLAKKIEFEFAVIPIGNLKTEEKSRIAGVMKREGFTSINFHFEWNRHTRSKDDKFIHIALANMVKSPGDYTVELTLQVSRDRKEFSPENDPEGVVDAYDVFDMGIYRFYVEDGQPGRSTQ
ncbi:hypothetical protein AJ79_09850 [Helicocarpus griseus UAMH5409]|uniref:Uncharacterized protein n=1 Tax=Helicocarpus griseus UAMH5409 TaxID=1447875 RepID=A0A2B7W8F7_9EURO|nr:hypothetical protein AJ79_09850 [Helicocarpus griseus UAMH5409]